MHPIAETAYQHLTDIIFAHWPRPLPPRDLLAQCRIISHRGEHDNRLVMENTLAAFEQVAAAGVWGIEFDIRWTRDAVPVVIHDPDLFRMFRIGLRIEKLTWRELRSDFGAIPCLAEVVAQFGGRLHLMIEIKACSWPGPRRQNQTLAEALQPLSPIRDYHIMSLTPHRQPPLTFLPPQALLAVSNSIPDPLSQWVLKNRWGGICGNYLLMRTAIVRKHLRLSQRVGTGFVHSRNCLLRELNRGVQWIFSNKALALQRILNRMKDRGRLSG